MKYVTVLGISASILCSATANAREYHVSADFRGASDGSAAKPFREISTAAKIMKPGDTCIVHKGVYRESVEVQASGEKGKPITFVAAPGERVLLSGADLLQAKWMKHRGNIYKAKVPGSVRQLFVEGKMMIEARWPNMSLDDLWNRNSWAQATGGSRYGTIIDPKLAATGIDWTGAIATLNVAHQFYSWTRTVTKHESGSKAFSYPKNLGGLYGAENKSSKWTSNRYFLTGKLEALDTEDEWFHDEETGTLYLWAPGGVDPGSLRIETKTRDFGFSGVGASHVRLAGFEFFACTFELSNADFSVIENCHVRYPNWARHLLNYKEAVDSDNAATSVSGNNITIRRCSVAWGPTSGLRVDGRRNLVEDCLFHDLSWYGSLKDPVLRIHSDKENEPADDRCVVRHCTLFNAGNTIIEYRNLPGHIIEYNHVYNGGLSCKDVALVHSGNPGAAGSIVRYNWVHGCYTDRVRQGLQGGLAIRGDDQTRHLTVHHNVVWDCGRDGIIIKGDFNRLFNNTVFDIGNKDRPGNYINLFTGPEPKKLSRGAPLLEVQNENSGIANNIALTIKEDPVSNRPYKFEKNLSHNYREADLPLMDIENYDFRPKPGSPLVDGGEHIPGFTDGYKGKAPDIGAYEHGGNHWIPGITWDPEKVLGDTPKGYIRIRKP